MFLKFISYIHKKPRHVRSLIALGTSVGLTLIIGGFWLVSYTQYVNEKMKYELEFMSTKHLAGISI